MSEYINLMLKGKWSSDGESLTVIYPDGLNVGYGRSEAKARFGIEPPHQITIGDLVQFSDAVSSDNVYEITALGKLDNGYPVATMVPLSGGEGRDCNIGNLKLYCRAEFKYSRRIVEEVFYA